MAFNSHKKRAVPETQVQDQEPRKARKRMAVTTTKDHSVIAAIRDNHSTSPLLSLPGEIREKILMQVLGGKCVHSKKKESLAGLCSFDDRSHYQSIPLMMTHICDIDPLQPFTHDETSSSDQVAGNTEHYCHKDCLKRPTSEAERRTIYEQLNKLPLALLGVCRQLYEECHTILWTTNVFVFNDLDSLRMFSSRLNSGQRKKLRTVHLCTCIQVSQNYRTHGLDVEGKELDFKTAEKLYGVQNLALCIHVSPEHSPYDPSRVQSSVYCALYAVENIKLLTPNKLYIHLEEHERNDTVGKWIKPSTLIDASDDFERGMKDPLYGTRLRDDREKAALSRIWTKERVRDDLKDAKRMSKLYKRRMRKTTSQIKKEAVKWKERAAGPESEFLIKEYALTGDYDTLREKYDRAENHRNSWEEKIQKKLANGKKKMALLRKMNPGNEADYDDSLLIDFREEPLTDDSEIENGDVNSDDQDAEGDEDEEE